VDLLIVLQILSPVAYLWWKLMFPPSEELGAKLQNEIFLVILFVF